MKLDRKHTEGFTLAELLLSVAIVMILAAMALPSLISAQNNLRMVELDNAAEALANAAQFQMTAKKAAGTWLALVEKGGTGSDARECVYPEAQNPPVSTDADDTFYLTADQARNAGIIPGLSVDETVRNGDYIIEFAKSTASVVSVFYSDGKTGFFGDAPSSTNAAQTYYESHGSRAADARKAASPMIGYYEGTPAEATNEVALANPVIWVDDKSELCVQNPNLGDHPDWDNLTSVTIMWKDGGVEKATLTIAGFDEAAQSYTVKSGDVSRSYSNTNKNTAAYEFVSRNALDSKDVFAVDLNDVLRVLEEDASAEGQELAKIANKLATARDSSGNIAKLEVKAHASVNAQPNVPSSATAFIEWPKKLATLSVFVTNPALEAKDNEGRSKAAHIYGKYEEPKVALVDQNGEPPATELSMLPVQVEYALADAGIATHDLLAQENVESGRQSYSGGWVDLATAHDQKASVRVNAGSYTSDSNSSIDVSSMRNPGNGEVLWKNGGTFEPSGDRHLYQIYEIWINGERAGYLNQGVWKWENTDLGNQFSQCVGTISEGSTSLTIDIEKLYDLVPQDFDGYEVYVRTTPKSSEVQAYFQGIAERLSSYFGTGRTTGSRGVNLGAPIRQPFENEFGASSTVGLYNITSDRGTELFDKTNFPKSGDLRIYYSATPAVAWNPRPGQANVYTELPSALLWLYEKKDNFKATNPQAYVRNSRTGNNYALTGTTSADFELSTKRDYLFCRMIQYCDDDGKPLSGYAVQYVPYSAQEDAAIQKAPKKEGFEFVGWQVDPMSTNPQGLSLVLQPGDVLGSVSSKSDGSLDSKLAYGRIQLRAQWKEISKPPEPPAPEEGEGFAYLEFDSKSKVSGYSGYINDKKIEYLPTGSDSEIASVGYYVITSVNSKPEAWGSWNSRLEDAGIISIGNASYHAYKVMADGYWWSKDTQTVTFEVGGKSQTVTFNMNFAAAVTLNQTDSKEWGDDEEWSVRHWTQFPGFLEIDNVQKGYLADAFKQTHDLDFEGHQVVWRSDASFQGEYDGGNQLIRNFKLNIDKRTQDAAGLFWSVKGAEIKNVNMVDVFQAASESEYTVAFESGGVSLGLLVGRAEGSEIEECTVEGKKNENGTPLSVYLRMPQDNAHRIGGLVGHATSATIDGEEEKTSIEKCSVQDISFVMVAQLPESSGRAEVNFGGLVGYAQKAKMEFKSDSGPHVIKNVSFQVHGKDSTNVPVYAGGLIGRFDAGENGNTDFLPKLFDGAITDVNITTNIGGTPSKLFVGSLIGFSDYKVPPGQLSEAWVSNVVHNGLNVELLVGNGKHKSASPNSKPSAEPQSNAEDSTKLPPVPSTNEGAANGGNSGSDVAGSGETTVPDAPPSNEDTPVEVPETSTPEAETVPEADAGEQGGSA